MKSRYKQWFWFAVIVDIALFILIILGAIRLIQPVLVAGIQAQPVIQPTATPSILPLEYSVHVSENIHAGQDFDLLIRVKNPNKIATIIHEVVLPRELTSQIAIIRSVPSFTVQNSYDDGEGFPVEIPLGAGEEKFITVTLNSEKMTALSGKVYLYTDMGKISQPLLFAVSPADPFAQANINEEIPYQATVLITSFAKDSNGNLIPNWYGSGSIVSPDGLILTNAHVVLPDQGISVDQLVISTLSAQDRPPEASYIAQVVQADSALDLAVLRIVTDIHGSKLDPKDISLPFIRMGDSNNLNLGDSLTILGFPGIGGETITLTRGEVSGFSAEDPYGDRAFIKTSAAISGGNSGGMAVDTEGRLVGIPTRAGSGNSNVEVVDCRFMADTNGDGQINQQDMCVPLGGFINALRPINLASAMIEAARRGEVKLPEPSEENIKMPTGSVVYLEDNFSDPNSGWATGSDEHGDMKYWNDAFAITINEIGWNARSGYIPKEFSDALFEVTSDIITESPNADYGVICRFMDNANYYLFDFLSDGSYAIIKNEQNIFTNLTGWKYSPLIPKDGKTRITTSCIGNILTIGVDGVALTQVKDNTFSKGRIGVTAGNYSEGPLTVLFDDVKILSP